MLRCRVVWRERKSAVTTYPRGGLGGLLVPVTKRRGTGVAGPRLALSGYAALGVLALLETAAITTLPITSPED
ncbi:hypothetical protein PN498_28470 [Oscillatoria sp. CS-180]|nr:hypothetical protein [Oscillatoria sp. CS-180]